MTATQVIIDAVKRVKATGKPVTRSAVRDAIQTVEGQDAARPGLVRRERRHQEPRHRGLPGHQDKAYPADDMIHQFKYIGTAPQS